MEKILRCLQVEGIILKIVRFVHDYFSWLIKGFPLAQLAPCEWKAGRKGHYYNSLMLPVSRIVTCMLLFVCNTIRMIRNLWPSSSHMFMREWCHTCQQENLQDNCWEKFFFKKSSNIIELILEPYCVKVCVAEKISLPAR